MIKLTFEDYIKNREKFSIQRILVRIDFSTDILFLYFYFKLLSQNNVTPEITYYTIQVIFIIGATLFNFVRFNRNYYFPLLREMPESLYWTYVLLILFLMRIPFISSFAPALDNPLLRIAHLTFSVVIIGQILFTFQLRFWASTDQTYRKRRLKALLKKARLSNNDYKKLHPILVSSANLREKEPIVWKILFWLFALIIAVMINDAASDFVDSLAKTFSLVFSNILPPY